MDVAKVGQLTMREKIRGGQHLARELHEHLSQNFLPKVTELAAVCTPEAEERIADVTIRNQVANVLESERFLAQKEAELAAYAVAISAEAIP
ncbi:MAG TPA: hypothetical protein VFG20_02295 [Planctomycetaceae bacterium]|nr:hypothetical protein [Planctomycetaceae bacterium]